MNFIWEEEMGAINIIGMKTEAVPMWTINHFFKSYCDNYVKLVLLTRLCTVYQNGISSNEIVVSAKSIPVVSDKADIDRFLYYNSDIVEYAVKEENPHKFWEIFNRCERPMIYYREGYDGLVPLYDYFGEEAIKVRKISYNSPVDSLIDGVVGPLIDLAEAKHRYEMEEEEHAARQIVNIADGCASITRVAQIINDDRTPPGVRMYAQATLDKLIDKQAKLNDKLGIRIERIDRRI